MYRILIVLFSFGIVACVSDNSGKEDSILLKDGQFPQTWELVSMSGMVANVPPTTGDEMAWQEVYLLNGDGTFIKSRDYEGSSIIGTGLYEKLELEDGEYFKFSYESDNDIIGNCTKETIEYLRFETANSLIGTWWACDGPGLFYNRTQ